MPIYEYRCAQCGYEFDELQKVSDAPLTECPQCAAHALQKKLSAPNFRLKGSGWYETDFKKDKDKKRNLADDGKGEAPKTDGMSDAKPDKGEKKPAADAKAAPAAKSEKSGKSSGDGGKAA